MASSMGSGGTTPDADTSATVGDLTVTGDLAVTGTLTVTGGIIGAVDVDDAPVNGDAAAAISSNWAFDHNAATTGVHGVGAGTVAKTSDITATKLDDLTAPDDNTDLNASTAKHGLQAKFPNTAGGRYQKEDGTWAVPSAGSVKLDDAAAPDDNTDLNASTTKHGLMMKYPNTGASKFLGEDGAWAVPAGGSAAAAPWIVAASDASAAAKAAATASGGAICDGSADDVQLNAAMDAGGWVLAVGSTWSLAAQVVVHTGCTLEFHGNATITPAGNIDAFKVEEGGALIGHGATIDYDAGTRTGIMISIDMNSDGIGQPSRYIVDGFKLLGDHAATPTCTGLSVPVKAGNAYLWGARVRNLIISGCLYGIRLTATGAATWINSNLFDNIQMDFVVYGIYMEASGGLGLDGNQFENITIQHESCTTCGIVLLGTDQRGLDNTFNIMFWDWTGGAASAMDIRGPRNTFRFRGLNNPETQIERTLGTSDGLLCTYTDEMHLSSDRKVGPLTFRQGTDLTISGGEITVPYDAGYFLINTEGSAASDNLDSIYGARFMNAACYLFSPQSGARTVVFKHGTGNLILKGGADKTLDDINDVICLMFDNTIGSWVEMFDSI